MAELQVFRFMEKEVRTALLNNEPYFCLMDVCDILELTNATVVAGRLKEEGLTKFNLGGRSGETTFVNESNLYKVIFQSRKAEAERFQDWVTGEVLPQIRKTGSYTAPGCEKEYQTKATSAGEVASLIKPVIRVMEKQGSRPYKIASQTEKTLNQFGIQTIPDFVEVPENQPNEQLSFEASLLVTMKNAS